MNHIQCLEDEQLQDVVGGAHHDMGRGFGESTSGYAVVGDIQGKPLGADGLGHFA